MFNQPANPTSKEETLIASGDVGGANFQPAGPRRWNRPSPMALTFALASTEIIDYIDRREIFDALGRAFNQWAQVVPISFLPITEYNEADIKVSFYIGKHETCPLLRDGSLGHSLGPNDGRIHINAEKQWCVGFAGRSKDAKHLEIVFMHEIGHTLGLYHSSNIEAVMYRNNRISRITELSTDDIQKIQEIYGPNPSFKLDSFPLESTVPMPAVILAMTEFFQSSTTSSKQSNIDWNVNTQICDCGVVATRFRSNMSSNYGRRYYKCASNSCSFFLWADPIHPERIHNVISSLLREKKELKELNVELAKKLHILEAENARLQDHSNRMKQKANSEELHGANVDSKKVFFFKPIVSVPVIISTIVIMSVCIIAKNCYKR